MLTDDQLGEAYCGGPGGMLDGLRRVEVAVRAAVAAELRALADSDDGLDGMTAEGAVKYAAGRVRDGDL